MHCYRFIIMLLVIVLVSACTQEAPVTPTPTSQPSPTVTSLPTPTSTLLPTHTPRPTPTVTALPETENPVHLIYVMIYAIDFHIELANEALNRLKDGLLPIEAVPLILQEKGLRIENFQKSLEYFSEKQIAIPDEIKSDWEIILSLYSQTAENFNNWSAQEISTEQLLVEQAGIREETDQAVQRAEQEIGKLVGESGEKLTKRRQEAFAAELVDAFIVKVTTPTEVLEACAGDSLKEADVSRAGKVAFVSDRDGNPEIYVMNADGSSLIRLTNNPAGDFNPTWSPDGTRVAFYSTRDGNAEIYVVNVDGTGETRLTDHPKNDFDPAFSPDGKRIAFHSHRLGENPLLFVMNADGSAVNNLSPMGVVDWSPDWSPDGTKILFNSGRGGGGHIWVMNANGSGAVQLTTINADDWWPDWSPDGKRIAFHSDRSGGFDIYLMNADGKDVTRLTDDPSLEYGVNWSADGSRVSFTSNRSGNLEICVRNVSNRGVYNLSQHPANDWAAAWAP